jgi:hypothetical protein
VLQLLHPDLELVVKSGFLYVPLLFDADIAAEIRNGPEPGLEENTLVEIEGKQFIKSVHIQSILTNYDRIDKDHYEQLRRDCLREFSDLPEVLGISSNSKLLTIVLQIMPYFLRKSSGLERRQLSEEELLDLICGKIDIPPGFTEQADKYLDPGSLRQRLNDLERFDQRLKPLRDGSFTGAALQRWLHTAVEVQIVNRERVRLEEELYQRERLSDSKKNHIVTLMYIAEKGSLEVDGFGFSRIGSSDDYLIYKRTGEYTLKDYYARNYRFPDCRVAVSTMNPFRPIVLERYKHPFLHAHAPQQEICLRGFKWPEEFSADNIIRLLEEGINALLYGYNARRRNGYHSLDPTRYYIKTIEFEDYRV